MSRPPAPPGSTDGTLSGVLTVEEAAKILRISRGLAFAAVRNGDIPHLRIARRILVPEHGLNALLGGTSTSASPERRTVSHDQPEGEDSPGYAKLAALRELAATREALVAESPVDRERRAGR